MNVTTWIERKVKGRIRAFVRTEVQKAMGDMVPLMPQLIEFHSSPNEARQSYYDHTKDPLGNRNLYAGLKDRVSKAGIPMEESDIDIPDFERWLREFPKIKSRYRRGGDLFIERCLRHYLTYRHLDMTKGDVFVDIGGGESPLAAILNQRGIRSYRLDLVHPPGINGINIGADASDTKLPDAFANALSLHNTFMVFTEDRDVLFLREAARILKEKGRFAIIPLFLDDTYFVSVSPFCDIEGIPIDPGAKRVWRDDGVNIAFSRHYSPESFKERIFANLPECVNGKVLYFRNLPEVMKRYHGQTIFSYFMFLCEKSTNRAVTHEATNAR